MVNDKLDHKTHEEAAADAVESAENVAEETGVEAAAAGAGEREQSDTVGARPRGGRSWLVTLFLLVLIGATAGAGGYFIFAINEGRKADRAELRSLTERLDALQQSHASLSENNLDLNNRLSATDEQLNGLMHGLNDLRRRNAGAAGWQLAEVKYLFRIASHRLALAQDLDTAQAVLQSADAMLREIPDPALVSVRERVIADLNRLKSTPRTDFSGLALTLGDLAARVDRFPLVPAPTAAPTAAADTAPPVEEENHWRRLGRNLWQELKSLLVITRADKDSLALLTPRERFFLHRNLRLQLEAARLAVLVRDEGQFRESVDACKDWLNEFFDTDDERVRGALDILENAAAADLHQPVPSIEATLNAFDEYLTR